jgi:hypothetical protein
MIPVLASTQSISAVLATLATPVLVPHKPLVLVQVEVNGKMECRWVEDR